MSDKGCVDSLTRNQVIHRPMAPLVDDTPVCFGERSFLEAAPDSGGTTYWYWEVDGDTYFHNEPSFITPPVAFFDTFWTEVISIRGCISERVPVVQQHYPIYDVEIAVNDSLIDFPNPILQSGLTTDVPASAYAWTFGDGGGASTPEPAYEYLHAGKYPVRLHLTDIHGCPWEAETYVEIRNNARVQVPTAFTPNGDGINDIFRIGYHLLYQFDFKVFNRFGQMVFQAQQPDFEWTGQTLKGNMVKEGVYVYRVQAKDPEGNDVVDEGTITVIR